MSKTCSYCTGNHAIIDCPTILAHGPGAETIAANWQGSRLQDKWIEASYFDAAYSRKRDKFGAAYYEKRTFEEAKSSYSFYYIVRDRKHPAPAGMSASEAFEHSTKIEANRFELWHKQAPESVTFDWAGVGSVMPQFDSQEDWLQARRGSYSWYTSIARYYSEIQASRAARSKKACSYCRESGHTARTCEHKTADADLFATAFKIYAWRVAEVCARFGLWTGSVVFVDSVSDHFHPASNVIGKPLFFDNSEFVNAIRKNFDVTNFSGTIGDAAYSNRLKETLERQKRWYGVDVEHTHPNLRTPQDATNTALLAHIFQAARFLPASHLASHGGSENGRWLSNEDQFALRCLASDTDPDCVPFVDMFDFAEGTLRNDCGHAKYRLLPAKIDAAHIYSVIMGAFVPFKQPTSQHAAESSAYTVSTHQLGVSCLRTNDSRLFGGDDYAISSKNWKRRAHDTWQEIADFVEANKDILNKIEKSIV